MTADRPLTYSEWMERKDSMTPEERRLHVEKARRMIRAEADAALRKPRKPAVRKPRRFPTSEEAAARPPERTKPTKLELDQERRRAKLTPASRALLEGIQDTIRRRADLELRPEPGVEPPEFPGTPEERAALQSELDAIREEERAGKRGPGRPRKPREPKPPKPRKPRLHVIQPGEVPQRYSGPGRRIDEAIDDFTDLDEPDEIARDLEDLI